MLKVLQKFKSILILSLVLLSIGSIFSIKAYADNQPTITEFQAVGGLSGITSGPDGHLWFTQTGALAKIWRMTLDGTVTEFTIPSSDNYAMGLGITTGPDGNIWYTKLGENKIGRITIDGIITEFTIPTINSRPLHITNGPDGNLWFTEQHGNKIGRITPSGTITEFQLPTLFSYPFEITTGPDGNLWFTEYGTNRIGRITTNGILTEFSIPTVSSNNPTGITAGPDGNIWFTESSTNKIGKITMEGIITEFSIPTINSYPSGIITGPDGNIWFTERSANKIGKITTDGVINEFILPSPNSGPTSITIGSDNNLWFTEVNNNKVGRISFSSIPTPTPTPVDTSLNVPYFSQNALPWGQSEYDHTQSLGFANFTMDRWGCAVTSVAMVLKYHGMNEMVDGTPINPGSLNEWLKSNNGYLTGYGKDGSYSYLSWPVIGKLTKQLNDAGKSSVKLEYRRAYPSAETTALLNYDLTVGNDIGKFPDILWVQNSQTSGHFVVAKGVSGNTYTIADPEWNYPDLTSFNDSYMQVDRYVPSHTNLSYILLVINPDVELLVTDPLGRRTGKYIHTGITASYNEIPDASYTFETPVVNPNNQGGTEQLGTGVNVFLLPQPVEGDYVFTVSSNTDANYTLNSSTFQDLGDNAVSTVEGSVASNVEDTLSITYSQTQESSANKIVTFQTIIDDINELYTLNLITQKNIVNNLIRNIEQAQKASLLGNNTKVQQNLDQFIVVLERNRGNKVTERAYQILISDVGTL